MCVELWAEADQDDVIMAVPHSILRCVACWFACFVETQGRMSVRQADELSCFLCSVVLWPTGQVVRFGSVPSQAVEKGTV